MTIVTNTTTNTTYRTSCSHSGGPYQWAATTEPTDDKHVGYGKTQEEAIADLERLLRERAEAAEQDRQDNVQEAELVKAVQAAKPKAENVIGADTEVDTQWVEYLIDRHGIKWLLETASEICGQKSEHIATNWQDANLAKRWDTLARAIGMTTLKSERL